MEKASAFFYHYNKPASRAAGCNVLSVHWRKQCFLVNSLECHVSARTADRKQQPRCVLRGRGVVRIEGTHAIITSE